MRALTQAKKQSVFESYAGWDQHVELDPDLQALYELRFGETIGIGRRRAGNDQERLWIDCG